MPTREEINAQARRNREKRVAAPGGREKEREAARLYRATEAGRAANRARIRRHQQRKAERVQEIREASPCADCGQQYPYYVMDFDHVRGDKLGDVASLVRRASWARVLEEIAKCELVCANCHRVRHHGPAEDHL